MNDNKIKGVEYFESSQAWISGTNLELTVRFVQVRAVNEFPKGPWKTKSDAELSVLYACPLDQLGEEKSIPHLLSNPIFPELEQFFDYNGVFIDPKKRDIRGLRVYCVRGLSEGKIGGDEFHKIRDEVIFGLTGSVQVDLETLTGQRKSYLVDRFHALRIPAGVMHRYRVLEENSSIFIIANTLYFPEDKDTYDSYSLNEWNKEKSDFSRNIGSP